MKIRNHAIVLFLSIMLSGLTVVAQSQPSSAKAKKDKGKNINLFNGKNLGNWVFKLRDPSVDPATVFSVNNGIIHIKGNPFGYMRTKEQYSNYKLHIEYRWAAEATNSGIFIHTQLPDTIWPKCIECQLAAGNAGDFICSGGSDMNERTDKSVRVIRKMNASAEKPAGEWNIIEISCLNNTIEVNVNGVLQNKGTGLNIDKGYICLQSEGKDIEFKNVYLTTYKK